MAATQRLQQGIRALLAFTRPVDYDLAAAYLNPAQLALFRQMKRSEQLHSLNVVRAIDGQGAAPDDLLVAALLHDVGKIRYPMAIWQKSLPVVVRHICRDCYARWSADTDAAGWRRMFAVVEHHPAWSAELVEPTGASDRAVWLIRHHADDAQDWQEHPYHAYLVRLQQADDTN